jgi:hypothetical protein
MKHSLVLGTADVPPLKILTNCNKIVSGGLARQSLKDVPTFHGLTPSSPPLQFGRDFMEYCHRESFKTYIAPSASYALLGYYSNLGSLDP